MDELNVTQNHLVTYEQRGVFDMIVERMVEEKVRTTVARAVNALEAAKAELGAMIIVV
jgi:hypothetical protein